MRLQQHNYHSSVPGTLISLIVAANGPAIMAEGQTVIHTGNSQKGMRHKTFTAATGQANHVKARHESKGHE